MSEYPKIDSVFQRDQRGRFTDTFACPEFEYLASEMWTWTEKVDGTNIRLYLPGDEHVDQQPERWVRGRTDNAQIPPKLLAACCDILRDLAPIAYSVFAANDVVLYGEGYGAGIQKGGMYRPDASFVLFDVRVGEWWLRRDDVEDVARNLGLAVVPVVEHMTLLTAIDEMRSGEPFFNSAWPGARPEGIVGRPSVDLWDRMGRRITTKLKFKDFR